MQSLHTRLCKAETRSRRIENIWFFRILIDLIFWQILVKSEKLDFAFFASMYARRSLFAFDALFFLSISRSFSALDIALTYFMNFLQSNCIDIESLMSQAIFENFEIHNDVIRSWCDSHSRQYRIAQTIDICFMMYRLFIFRYLFSHRCFISWRFKTRSQFFSHSIARLANRFYVIFETHQISIRSFLQFSHSCMISLRHRESLLENFKQHIVEKACSKVSNNTSLRKL